jgi:hypothetical protein
VKELPGFKAKQSLHSGCKETSWGSGKGCWRSGNALLHGCRTWSSQALTIHLPSLCSCCFVFPPNVHRDGIHSDGRSVSDGRVWDSCKLTTGCVECEEGASKRYITVLSWVGKKYCRVRGGGLWCRTGISKSSQLPSQVGSSSSVKWWNPCPLEGIISAEYTCYFAKSHKSGWDIGQGEGHGGHGNTVSPPASGSVPSGRWMSRGPQPRVTVGTTEKGKERLWKATRW